MKNITGTRTAFVTLFAGLVSSALLYAAATHDPGTQPMWDIAPFGLKSTDLHAGATKAYRPWFENGAWQGDIIEYNIATNGARTPGSWNARGTFAAKEASVVDYWKALAGRKIITFDGTYQIPFRWDELTAAQGNALDPVTAADNNATGSYDSPVLNYIRGDRSLEIPIGTLRTRYSLLGDIVHSQPIYIGAPTANYSLTGYAAFKNSHANRAGRVYVGANDGMIHVFDAQDGTEAYAYVPSMLMAKLNLLTKASYLHTYYADGQLTAADVAVSGTWKTVLAGGLGAGAKGLFALDVTDPNLSSETADTGTNSKILWEKTGSALGYIHGRPRIAKLPDGKAYVVTGNGYGSDDDVAKLYLAPLNGDAVSTITTAANTGNGLSAPALLDNDNDGDADYAYAGDLLGNLWRFDLTAGTALKLFAAGTNKPITTAPDITAHTYGGHLIYFGTGSLLSSVDKDNQDQQTIYAIWDKAGNNSTVLETNLQTQTLTAATHVSGKGVRVATDNAVNWSTQYGWKVDLPGTGERLIGNPQLRGKRLQFVSDSPDRSSWLLGLDWLSGGDPHVIQYDLDDDGVIGSGDQVTISSVSRIPVGISLGIANSSQPLIARISGGVDIHYINGLVLATQEPCTGNCSGGIARGHIDVDMDTELGGGTDSHKHEYDDSYDVTYVDYFGLLSGDPIDTVGIGGDTEMIVVLANADLSPGGVLTIDDKEWNVVDYQEMVQKKLKTWDGSSTLLDDDGDSLVFTLNDIVANGGTLRTSFNSESIGAGGVIPTKTGCVGGSDYWEETGRWRNGALTLHALDFNKLEAGGKGKDTCKAKGKEKDPDPNKQCYEQHPVDLLAGMDGGGVIANPINDVAFLYESTVFWHWSGDFAKEVTGDGGMCYGEAGWAEAAAAEIEGVTPEILETLFPGYAANEDTINQLLGQMDSYVCEKGIGEECDGEDGYKAMVELIKDLFPDGKNFLEFRDKWKEYFGPGDGDGPDDGSTGLGTPADVTDQTEDLTPVLGPDFQIGRRAWIDP